MDENTEQEMNNSKCCTSDIYKTPYYFVNNKGQGKKIIHNYLQSVTYI